MPRKKLCINYFSLVDTSSQLCVQASHRRQALGIGLRCTPNIGPELMTTLWTYPQFTAKCAFLAKRRANVVIMGVQGGGNRD